MVYSLPVYRAVRGKRAFGAAQAAGVSARDFLVDFYSTYVFALYHALHCVLWNVEYTGMGAPLRSVAVLVAV